MQQNNTGVPPIPCFNISIAKITEAGRYSTDEHRALAEHGHFMEEIDSFLSDKN